MQYPKWGFLRQGGEGVLSTVLAHDNMCRSKTDFDCWRVQSLARPQPLWLLLTPRNQCSPCCCYGGFTCLQLPLNGHPLSFSLFHSSSPPWAHIHSSSRGQKLEQPMIVVCSHLKILLSFFYLSLSHCSSFFLPFSHAPSRYLKCVCACATNFFSFKQNTRQITTAHNTA